MTLRLSSLLFPFARRFVAGETAEEAIAAARGANGRGISAIVDFLGEDVASEAGAQHAVDEYLRLIRLIHSENVRAAVSLKVSQMGIHLSRELCLTNLRKICQAAASDGIFVWFDMEGSALTQKTIELFDELRQDYKDVGLCLQAYLVRTGGDLDKLGRKPFHVRLCKGAYKEPAHIAYSAKSAVDGSYRMLVQKLFDQVSKGIYPAFGTHDHRLIEFILDTAATKNVAEEKFEFQMLYGIQTRLLESLSQRGNRTSVYIPYGTHWLPYFIRRIRERKENLYFLIRNVFSS